MIEPISLGPWSGIDNVHKGRARIFQPGEAPAAQMACTNFDLDDDGWPIVRSGLTERVTLTAGANLFATDSILLLQEGGVIKQVFLADWSTTDLVTGLDSARRVTFHQHADKIYWTNGVERGRIVDDSGIARATNWGCATPTAPVLTAGSGSLSAGRYLVAIQCRDAEGIEHSISPISAIDLSAGSSITVNFGTLDTNAVSVRVYVSQPNDKQLFWAQDENAVAGSTVIFSRASWSKETPDVLYPMEPPPPADCLFSFRGMMMLGVENAVFPSYGAFTHLYDLGVVQDYRTSTILAGAGLDLGFWTVSADGAYWTEGEDPKEWRTYKRSGLEFCRGVRLIDGARIPALQTKQEVALFVSHHGLMAALPTGFMYSLSPNKLRLAVTDKQASIVYRETEDPQGKAINQLLYSLG